MENSARRQSDADMKRAEYEVLAQANEDWYGLWELPVSFRALFPGKPDSQIVEMARDSVQSLLRKGFIYVCDFRHEGNLENTLSPDQAVAAISNPEKWSPPADVHETYIAFTATKSGERAWRESPPGAIADRGRGRRRSTAATRRVS